MADRIEKLMAEWEPVIRDAVIESFRRIRDRLELKRLVELIKANDVEGVIAALRLERASFRPLSAAIERAFEAGGVDATAGITVTRNPLGLQIAPLFDVKDYTAARWIEGRTTDLITQITEDQRVVVRQTLAPLSSGADAMLTGQTPQKLALDLVGRVSTITGRREGGVLGLTSQQAEWARNYEVSLGDVEAKVLPSADALTRKLRDKRFDRALEKAIRTEAPIPAKTRQAMVAAYRNRTLRYRAETIALNEASTSLHASQIEAWDQAIRRGAVTETAVRRFWITAGDDHVRPSHRAVPSMNDGGVGLHAAFLTPKGPTMQPGWEFDPGCRCRVRVRVVEPEA